MVVHNSWRRNDAMQVEAEVSRLEELKSSKMKELVLKKRAELEEICRKTHLVPEVDVADDYVVETIESGTFLSIFFTVRHLWARCRLFLFQIQSLTLPCCRICGPCFCA